MEEKPGFRFKPTDEELINYYLKNKIFGNNYLVDDTINEINILNYHPASFSSLSRIKSKDRVYYFFAMKRYKNGPKNMRNRSTIEKSWYWKVSGKPIEIKDESRNKIGEKQVLLYKEYGAPETKGKESTWVMHEYHITSLSHLNLDSYVICKIFDKRSNKANISNGNNSSEPSLQSLVSVSNTVTAISIPPEDYGDDYFNGLLSYNGGNFEDVFSDQELIMQQNRNDYKPKKALSGVIVVYSSDSGSDAESISAKSYKGTSSPNDSVGSSNRHYHKGLDEILSLSKDIRTSADPSISISQLTRRTISSKQEVKQDMMKTKKVWFVTEEAMERNCKNPPYIYLINFIIGFILLLALIGNILPVYN